MPNILCIETATDTCSVSIVNENGVLAVAEILEGNSHASLLTTLIEDALKEAQLIKKELHAVAVSKGPGSYTGLRVGVSTAKGLCYALDLPLIGINTLVSLTTMAAAQIPKGEHVFIPMLDARRMEVYCAILDASLNFQSPTEAKILDEHSFTDELDKGMVYFFGTGAAKFKSICQHPNAHFITVRCSAVGLHQLAIQAFQQQQFEDLAYFEPFYLKDFVGTTPKKLV